MASGVFTLQSGSAISFDKSDVDEARVAAYFAGLAKRLRGVDLVPKADDAKAAIVFRRISDPTTTGKEGYTLDVSPEGITVSASQTAGLFYGAITLSQLLSQDTAKASRITLPALHIEDAPRFAWRGLML